MHVLADRPSVAERHVAVCDMCKAGATAPELDTAFLNERRRGPRVIWSGVGVLLCYAKVGRAGVIFRRAALRTSCRPTGLWW